MQASSNIFLIGPMGSGKSTIGRLLAAELGAPFFDSDHEIERRCGCDIPWIFDIEGESGFRLRETQVIEQLTRRHGIVLATGGGAVTREANRQLLAERGVVILLHTTVAQQLKRTARDQNRPLLNCEDPAERLRQLMAEREPFYREVADIEIHTERRGPRGVIADIKRQLKRYWREQAGIS